MGEIQEVVCTTKKSLLNFNRPEQNYIEILP